MPDDDDIDPSDPRAETDPDDPQAAALARSLRARHPDAVHDQSVGSLGDAAETPMVSGVARHNPTGRRAEPGSGDIDSDLQELAWMRPDDDDEEEDR